MIYFGANTYDLAGQLTGETLAPGIAPVAVSLTQTFDSDNRLLTHNGAATTFDTDGNLLSVASGLAPSAYSYDARNRLTSAGGLTYGYNAENRRVSITSGAGTTSYVINPNAALDQMLVRTAPDGTKTFYVYGLGLLHEEAGSTVRYYHHDRRGDTIALTDGIGAVTDRASYGVYGEMLSRTGTTNTPFLFNGKWGVQTDSNGLYYHRARYYHPGLRRFLNQDAVLGSIGGSASMNRFAYANGSPITAIDPFGLMAMDDNYRTGQYWRDAGKFFLKYLGGVAAAPFMTGYTAGTGLLQATALLADGQTWRDAGRMLADPIGTKQAELRAWAELAMGMGAALQDPFTLGNVVGGFAMGGVGRPPPMGTPPLLAVENMPAKLYHYTGETNAPSIVNAGLGASGRQVFTTPAGNLSPVQAQIELALPANRGYPGALFETDTARLQQLGIQPSAGPQRIMSTPTAAGGGVEIIFNQPIPPSAIRQIPFP